MAAIEAIYRDGQLRLLDPVDLAEGQRVRVTIQTVVEEWGEEEKHLRAVLGDMVRWPNPDDDRDAWVELMVDEIDQAYQGEPPLSEVIIQDRGEG